MADSNLLINLSHRRVEALKFLSSITLDGSYCDPSTSLQNNGTVHNDVLISTNESGNILEDIDGEDNEDHENVFSKNDHGTQTQNKFANGDVHSLSSGSDNKMTPIRISLDDAILTKGILTYSAKGKKRTRTSYSESATKIKTPTSRKRNVHHTAACSDSERHFGSSCESICAVTTNRIKTKSSKCNAITEVNGGPTVKFIKSVKDHKFNGERIFMVTKKNRVPFLVCSFIPYGRSEKNRSEFHKEVLRKRHVTKSRPISTVGDLSNQFEMFGIVKSEDGQEVSYGKLLVPTRSLKEFPEKKHSTDLSADLSNNTLGHSRHLLARTKVLTRKPGFKWCYSYDQTTQRGMTHSITSPPLPNLKDNIFMSSLLLYNPILLDDPELIAGRHRTLLTFSSYVTSVIDYVRPCDLKKEINDKFKEKFPHIKLTLSKLRSIKKEMCKIARTEGGTELVTVAQAYVYFEKLILRGLINKQNRKLCAAASLLLSAKLNDIKGDALKTLIERTENIFRLNRKEVFEAEFAVLVALEFGLHIPASEVFPHYQRLLYEL